MARPDAGPAIGAPAGAAAVALGDADVQAAVGRFAAHGADAPATRFAAQVEERRVEYDALVALLLQSATPGAPPREVEQVARAIAAACLGEQHLWRELELPSRRVLRGLFEAYFEPLAADNVMDMRWKKFLYRRLCRWGGFNTCPAPSCGACASYAECYES